MKEIGRRRKLLEESPGMTPPIGDMLNFNGVVEYGNNLLLRVAPEINDIDPRTKAYLHHIADITKKFPDCTILNNLEDYMKEVKGLRESTSTVPSVVTPAMVQTEALDTELAEIGWGRFISPWCTGYSPKRYR